MFRFVSEQGTFLKNAAIIHDIDKDMILAQDCRNGTLHPPTWINTTEAIKIIEKHNMLIVNRSGKCLTFLEEF